jgi:tetratricopeptide (TPR) repeat protein
MAFLLFLSPYHPSRASHPAPVPPAKEDPTTAQYSSIDYILELCKRKDLAMATNVLEAMLSRPELDHDTKAKAILLLASLELENNQKATAVVRLNLWLSSFPGHRETAATHFLLGQAYRSMGAIESAKKSFYSAMTASLMHASKDTRKDVSERISLAQAASWEIAETEYSAGQWERAQELYERFKTQNSGKEELVQSSLYRQADCEFQLRKMESAIEKYKTALAAGPFHPFAIEAWLRLTILYGESHQLQLRDEALNTVIWMAKNLQPNDALYWKKRCAEVLLRQLQDDPTQQAALLVRVGAIQGDEQWEKTLAYYRAWVERHSKDPIPAASKQTQDYENWMHWKVDFDKGVDRLEVRWMRSAPPESTSSETDETKPHTGPH